VKTEPDRASRAKSRRWIPDINSVALTAILALSAALRLWHVDFGLPALNDPDEPLFVMTALDMLREQRLNPQWFGHPATILFYALAAIFIAVGWLGVLFGRWADTAHYVSAIYADPSIAILPMRVFIVLMGVVCVYLTYRIGRQAISVRAGLIAAAVVAVNNIHVELSQVIRTDMVASIFMLGSCLYAIRAAQGGKLHHYILMGVMIGLGGATKWPSLLFMANAPGAVLNRWRQQSWVLAFALLAIVAASALVALFLASPYLLLDQATVLRDLSGEARPNHPGSTGGPLFHNILWYGRHVLFAGFGPAGTILALAGLVLMPFRAGALALAGLPGALLFLLGIGAQALVWDRWAVPLIPWIALAIALALNEAISRIKAAWSIAALAATLSALLLPMAQSSLSRSHMRANDTRQLASLWIRTHVPATRSVLIEDAAFDLVARPGPVIFPLGDAGCLDAHGFLQAKPSYKKVEKKREGKSIVDVGHVAPGMIASCSADIAVITHYDRYLHEKTAYPDEISQYEKLLQHGKIMAIFRPEQGRIGGPVTRIYRFHHAAGSGHVARPTK
jgi:MFS family permease